MIDELELFKGLGVALVIGALIGTERGWRQRELAEGARVAGIRTFSLIGLLGGVLGALSMVVGDYMLAIGLLAFSAVAVVAHWVRAHGHNDVGMTTLVAEMLTLSLAMLAVRVSTEAGAAGAVVTVALLGAKQPLHQWLNRIEQLELTAAIKLLLISVVLLPILPNQGYGPGERINPFALWLLVVAIAGLSFTGYFAIKLAGPRLGSLLTGVFGGLASSTALTVSLSRLGKSVDWLQPTLAAGVAVGAATMLVRLGLIVGVINTPLLLLLVWPLGAMAAVGYCAALLLWWRSGMREHKTDASLALKNPFELGMALKFAMLLATVLLLAEMVKRWLGDAGLYGLAAISGLADVDAISVSLANMAGEQTALAVAATGIVIAAVVNTVVKAALVGVLCGGTMATRVGAVVAAMVVAAGAGWWLAE